jgi:tetratricopeptide (TPR) repeat protein
MAGTPPHCLERCSAALPAGVPCGMAALCFVPACLLLASAQVCASAQGFPDLTALDATSPLSVAVVWSAPGAVKLPSGPDWKLIQVDAFDKANRVVVLFQNVPLHVTASYIIFPNLTDHPDAEGCRADVIPTIRKKMGKLISDPRFSKITGTDGQSYPSASHLVAFSGSGNREFDNFAFAGDAKTCIEIHVSSLLAGAAAEFAAEKVIREFRPVLGYQPTVADLYLIGLQLFERAPIDAAPFFGMALPMIPVTPATLDSRRRDTDRLVVALARGKQMWASERYATVAAKSDPDYPMNDYNLARAEADRFDDGAAIGHLKKAFANKENTLAGEHVPDPRLDPIFAGLAYRADFRSLLSSIPPSGPPPALKTRTTGTTAGAFELALPGERGRLTLQAPSFHVAASAARPDGKEFGLRGDDPAAGIGFAALLLFYADRIPEGGQSPDEKCAASVLAHEKVSKLKLGAVPADFAPANWTHLAVAQYKQHGEDYVRVFAARGLLCADVAFYSKHAIGVDTPEIRQIVASLDFDPDAENTFTQLIRYATTLYEHKSFQAAGPIYAEALTMLPADDANQKWLRTTTDQAVMAYGISGDLKQSMALARHGIEVDPDYPMNYYTLARADAELGDAAAARTHLQQAFARKANTLPGERMPDPTHDDSLLKLKKDAAFWSFVETLN